MNTPFGAAVANDNDHLSVFPPSNSVAQNHYLTALRHLIRLEEAQTGASLNNARRSVLTGENGSPRHWSSLASADLRAIMPDLTVARFNALYGDLHYQGGTPWVLPTVITMVGDHLKVLGTDKDLYDYLVFVQKHAPESVRTRAALTID